MTVTCPFLFSSRSGWAKGFFHEAITDGHILSFLFSPLRRVNPSHKPHASVGSLRWPLFWLLIFQEIQKFKNVIGQEATVRTGHGTTDWFQIGKGVRQGCILSPCLFNLYAEYIMRNAGLEEAQLESRLPGEISITSDMQMTPSLWQKVKRNSKAS